MAEEQLYTVDGARATPATRISLTEAGLREREHLQEWILAHPGILGEDVLIVTFEFDRWITGAGDPTWERLDVLALDRTGHLVLAELKRDRASDAVMVQALNYAAMASRFNLHDLAEAYAHRHGSEASADEVLEELRDWAPNLTDESLSPPRIVLVAEDFGPVLTKSAMFLIEQGLDLRLVRVQLYRMGQTLALTSSQLLPVPDAEEFMVRPRSAVVTQRSSRAVAARRASVPERLVTAGVFADGEELRIVVPSGVVEDREAVAVWLAEDPDRSLVRWRQYARAPAEWAIDGKAYNLTTLIRQVIESATGLPARTQVWGPNWYQSLDGTVIHKIADALPDARTGHGRFDWSGLHHVLEQLPQGRWTTYGDLAAVVGTGAQALDQHITACAEWANAHRSLGSKVVPGPTSAGGSRRHALAARRVEGRGHHVPGGAADPDRRLHIKDLRQLGSQL